IVLDEHLDIQESSQLARTAREAPVLVFTGDEANSEAAARLKKQGVEAINAPASGRDVLKVLEELGRRSIQSVLVEGGAAVAGAFIDAGLVDKITFFVAPVIIGGNEAPSAVRGVGFERMADALRLEDVEIARRGDDVEITGYPKRRDAEKRRG